MASPSLSLAPHIFTCLQCLCSDFCTQAGLTKHQNAYHHKCLPDRNEFSDKAMFIYCYHPHMTGTFIPFEAKYHYLTSILLRTPCNKVGKDLPLHLPHTSMQMAVLTGIPSTHAMTSTLHGITLLSAKVLNVKSIKDWTYGQPQCSSPVVVPCGSLQWTYTTL